MASFVSTDLTLGPCSYKFLYTERGALVHHIAWTPPFEDSWKLNFGACIVGETNIAGAGCILRDQNAIFKAACAAPLKDLDNITMAEFSALKAGLCMANRGGVDYLEIEGDFSIVIQMLMGEITPVSSSIQQLLDDCIFYLRTFRSVNISQVHAYANEAAKKLAAMATNLKEPSYWMEIPPSAITQTLVNDVIGRWVPQFRT